MIFELKKKRNNAYSFRTQATWEEDLQVSGFWEAHHNDADAPAGTATTSWWETLLATSWGCILYIPYLLGSRSSFSFFFPPWFQFRFYMRWNFWKKHNLLLCKTCSFCYTRVLYSRSVERWTIFLWRLCCVCTCVRLWWWIFPKDDTLLWPITTMGYSCLFPPENSMI